MRGEVQMSVKTYKGSCHCGRVQFEADIDLRAGTGRCNCSICTKIRKWGTIVKPQAFRLLVGEHDLADYQFGTKQGHHRFCRVCGVHAFGHGNIPEIGGAYYSVNVACLDNAEDVELATAPVNFFDGRHNNWGARPAETRHL
jgi:hypothetical protein